MSSPGARPPDPSSGGHPAPAFCYRHPRRETYVRCVRCERPICPECMRPAAVGFQCPDDVRSGRRTIRAPRTVVGGRVRQSRPWVTLGLIAACVAVYLVTALTPHGSIDDPTGSTLFLQWQLFPQAVHSGDYYQLLTSLFLHLSLLHIATNMLSLAIIGPPVEALLGRWRFLALYLVCGLAGSAAVYAFGNPIAYTAGASGAIFGLFGAALVLVRKLRLDTGWLVGIIVLNIVLTFSVPGISELGHVGGLVAGLLGGVAIGGLPRSSTRVPTARQVAGLAGLFLIAVLMVAVRSATW